MLQSRNLNGHLGENRDAEDPINLGQVKALVVRRCVTPKDTGVYTCVATTREEQITAVTTVIVGELTHNPFLMIDGVDERVQQNTIKCLPNSFLLAVSLVEW